jgi:tetratricopeptide (TPR) repeat protein
MLSDEGRFERAEQLLLRLTNLPEPPGNTWFWLSRFYADWGRFDSAHGAAADNLRLIDDKRNDGSFAILALTSAPLGLFDESNRWTEEAEQSVDDDLPPIDLWSTLGRIRGAAPRLVANRSSLRPLPDGASVRDRIFVLGYGGLYLINTGDVAKGVGWLERAVLLHQRDTKPEEPADRVDLRVLEWNDGLIITIAQRLVFGYRHAGRDADAEAVLADLLALYGNEGEVVLAHPRGLADRALAYALAGDYDVALATLRQAVDLGWAGYYEALNDPAWGDTFERPGFDGLLREMKTAIERQRAAVEAGRAGAEET